MNNNNNFTLPELDYAYDALQPTISADIMELHHDKHHRTYVEKLNTALEEVDLPRYDLVTILRSLDQIPEAVRMAVRNNGGGHYNHSLFWQWMSPNGGGKPAGELAAKIDAKYGDFQTFVSEFNDKATALFGSGWVWLQPDMSIATSPNQDNPLMSGGDEPLLGLDVWEHAYYLDYKNVRADYIEAWWNVVDWKFVAERYQLLAHQE